MDSVSEFLSCQIAKERKAASNGDALVRERVGVGIDRAGRRRRRSQKGLRALHINVYEIKTGLLSSQLIKSH